MSFLEEVKHLQIPLCDILLASNSFAQENFIGQGGFGRVYQGQFEPHGAVAIKRLDPRGGQGDHEFVMEIAMLSSYKHENLVSLVGFCNEGDEKILVYKNESNGSLDKLLDSKDLTWMQRLRICLGAARGLKYLHHDVGQQHRVLHRDIKSSNILLDNNWVAKISDFGLSKIGPANVHFTFLFSSACGTLGYVDPQYVKTGILTKESDVYSFGVVLSEVLCARLVCMEAYNDERRFLVEMAQHHFENKSLVKIVDPDLWKQMNPFSLGVFSTVAYQCLKKHREERPTMSVVVQVLEKALDYQQSNRQESELQEINQAISSLHSLTLRSVKYDVFVNFRAEEFKEKFVERLYDSLDRKGFHIYKPEEALVGQTLLNAIEESRVAVVVFSPNYASSIRCLDELAAIMECKRKRGQIVMPFFYNVRELEIWTTFAQHKTHNRLEVWRNALMESIPLSHGYLADDAHGYGSKFVSTFVKAIKREMRARGVWD